MLVVLGSPFLGKILLTFVVVPVHVETCEVMVGSNVLVFSGGYLGYAYAPLTAQQLSAAGLSAAAGLPAAYAAAAGPTTAAGQAQQQPQDTRIQ